MAGCIGIPYNRAMNDSIKPESESSPLRQAMRTARIEAAERSAVIVELRDAEAARLEILNDLLDDVFSGVPGEHRELFDRGIAGGTQPRLWIDMVAHVAMGRDKRTYRFLQDTVHGRRVLAQSLETAPIVEAVTKYVARRIVMREQMLAATDATPVAPAAKARLTLARLASIAPRMSDPWLTLFVGVGIGAIVALIVVKLF
jgi:hypothetical protein